MRAAFFFGYNRPMPIAIDKLVRSRRKTIALIVERDGRLTVRAPLRMAEARIHEFVESHADWIAKNQAKVQAAAPPPQKQYADGETFLYLGKSYPLRIVPPQRPALKFDGCTFRLAKSARPKAEQAFIRWYKAQAWNCSVGTRPDPRQKVRLSLTRKSASLRLAHAGARAARAARSVSPTGW